MTISQFMSDIQECNNQLKALKQHLVDEVQGIVNEMTPRVSEFLLIYEEAIDKLSDSDFTPVSTNTIGDDFFIKRGIYSEYDESSPSYSIGLLDSFCLDKSSFGAWSSNFLVLGFLVEFWLFYMI